MCFAGRKCACRRELNSHELQFSVVQRPEADWHSARTNSLISVRAGVSAGQIKCTRKPPEGDDRGRQRASGEWATLG